MSAGARSRGISDGLGLSPDAAEPIELVEPCDVPDADNVNQSPYLHSVGAHYA